MSEVWLMRGLSDRQWNKVRGRQTVAVQRHILSSTEMQNKVWSLQGTNSQHVHFLSACETKTSSTQQNNHNKENRHTQGSCRCSQAPPACLKWWLRGNAHPLAGTNTFWLYSIIISPEIWLLCLQTWVEIWTTGLKVWARLLPWKLKSGTNVSMFSVRLYVY